MFGSLTGVFALVALAALSAGGLAYALLYGRIESENTAARRLEFVQGKGDGVTADAARGRQLVDVARRRRSVQETLKDLEANQKAKNRKSKAPPIKLRMEQAGLSWSKRTFYLISAAAGAGLFVVFFVFNAPLWVAAVFGLVGLLGLPRWLVNYVRKRRLAKFIEEFANSVDVIVRGVKAGLPLNDCLRIITNEAPEPVRGEFRHVMETQAMGIPLADAVGRLPERVPVAEANFFAIVISIQQRAGGNLAEALGNLSNVLRERKKMRGKIGAMSMEAKASAAIIGALPLIVMFLVYLTSPDYIALLFTEAVGRVILILSAFWMFLGVMIMRKMINFDF